jgi:hypothetical protein
MIDEEITQADRDAAAAYMEVVGDKRWSIEGILSGGCDNTSIVRAFARHRLRHPQTEQGLSVGEIGLVYSSAIEAVEEQQTDALKAENERLRSIVYLYVDPFDVTPEDEDFVQSVIDAVLQEQSK